VNISLTRLEALHAVPGAPLTVFSPAMAHSILDAVVDGCSKKITRSAVEETGTVEEIRLNILSQLVNSIGEFVLLVALGALRGLASITSQRRKM
jgi:hypothetical protein